MTKIYFMPTAIESCCMGGAVRKALLYRISAKNFTNWEGKMSILILSGQETVTSDNCPIYPSRLDFHFHTYRKLLSASPRILGCYVSHSRRGNYWPIDHKPPLSTAQHMHTGPRGNGKLISENGATLSLKTVFKCEVHGPKSPN